MSAWKEFKKKKIAVVSLYVFGLFFLVGLYAPFFASSKPIALLYDGKLYFPLFRYLFYPGFFTKPIDLFYNLLMFTLPLGVLGWFLLKKIRLPFVLSIAAIHFILFSFIVLGAVKNPELNLRLEAEKKNASTNELGWAHDLKYMNAYTKLNLALRYKQQKEQDERLAPYIRMYESQGKTRAHLTLFASEEKRRDDEIALLKKSVSLAKETSIEEAGKLPELIHSLRPLQHDLILSNYAIKELEKKLTPESAAYEVLKKELIQAQAKHATLASLEREKVVAIEGAKQSIQNYRTLSISQRALEDKRTWEKEESEKIKILLQPLLRSYHWEDDAGGGQGLNKYVPWWELTRLNRKDLASALLFGIRISLVVGVVAVAIALLIGIPLGVFSGYFAGAYDMIICRLIEIWEAMPAFFMLLLIVAIVQSKSLFLVILILALFGWTHFARYIRGEVLKQRNLPYVLAGHSLGFSHSKIMCSHILPNAIPPILTLLPFSMMAAITSEAGLSFLGLGEEGSTSWGVLMAEGRSVFPGESYLLWPPAILLTILLVSIALIGDALRDALDPKMRQ